jgi:glycosyltransferase involved in cell wall biosynthesis
MRKPVVATRVDGCVDAVEEDRTGILVEPRDAQALAHAIARYLSDPGLREAHGAAARERVETLFDRRAIWGAIADIYFRIASRRGDAAGRS